MKRKPLTFDTAYFKKKRESNRSLSVRETFEEIYRSKHWQGEESVSGRGSDDSQTEEIIRQIPKLVRKLKIKKILDVPCGDFNWFGKMDLRGVQYIGGDLITELIEKNAKYFGSAQRSFTALDLIKDPLPSADLLLCRDCLVHLSTDMIQSALQNIKNSQIKYLLTTTFPYCDVNEDIVTGDWRIINLERPPFNLPKPAELINEKCTEGEGTYEDKSLGLWKISDL